MRCDRARPALFALLDAEALSPPAPAGVTPQSAPAGVTPQSAPVGVTPQSGPAVTPQGNQAAAPMPTPPGVDPDAARHIAQCLRCQAELAQHRRIRRQMIELRAVTVEPAPTMLDSILAGLTEQAAGAVSGSGRSATYRRRLLALGAAAAASAGVAGAVVLATRSSRSRRDDAGSHIAGHAV